MAGQSAGLVLYRRQKELEFFLVHPGGPFWARKDLGSWSVPKGEYHTAEDPLEAAKREFFEETGAKVEGAFVALSPITQKAGKTVSAWAVEGDIDAGKIVSNTFEMEWPPKSGKKKMFPEIDRAQWFTLPEALEKINKKQAALLLELAAILEQNR